MLEELQQLFNTVTGKDDIRLTERTKLKTEMGVTSLTLITLVCAIEEKYGVEIPNTKLRRLKTVGDVLRFLENAKTGGGRS